MAEALRECGGGAIDTRFADKATEERDGSLGRGRARGRSRGARNLGRKKLLTGVMKAETSVTWDDGRAGAKRGC